MIRNIIQLKLRPGKVDEVVALYGRHFDALKLEGDRVKSYEVFVDRNDPTVVFALKSFGSEEDLQKHNNSGALRAFLGELREYIEDGADYHECTEIAGY